MWNPSRRPRRHDGIGSVAFALCVLAALAPCTSIGAQQPSGVKRGIGSAGGMAVEDVVKLVRAGISEDIIVQQIRKGRRAFDLSTDQLIELKSASVSDRIIQSMLDPSRNDNVSP